MTTQRRLVQSSTGRCATLFGVIDDDGPPMLLQVDATLHGRVGPSRLAPCVAPGWVPEDAASASEPSFAAALVGSPRGATPTAPSPAELTADRRGQGSTGGQPPGRRGRQEGTKREERLQDGILVLAHRPTCVSERLCANRVRISEGVERPARRPTGPRAGSPSALRPHRLVLSGDGRWS